MKRMVLPRQQRSHHWMMTLFLMTTALIGVTWIGNGGGGRHHHSGGFVVLAQEDDTPGDGSIIIGNTLISLCELDMSIVDEPCTIQNRYCLTIQPLPESDEGGEGDAAVGDVDTDSLAATATANGGIIQCGPCLQGFIEFGLDDVCTEIDTITWERFVQEYGPIFAPIVDDEGDGEFDLDLDDVQRLVVLVQAMIFINIHNIRVELANVIGANVTFDDIDIDLDNVGPYKLGLTKFSADDTDEDYFSRSGYFFVNVTGTDDEIPRLFGPGGSRQRNLQAPTNLPARVDWVERGGVTSVKDQGRCGCCWAVSLSGAIEGAAFANNGYFQSVSFQQFISCNDDNLGCNGGNLIIAAIYSVLNTYEGITRLNEYEYTDYKGETTETCALETTNYPRAVTVSNPELVGGFDFDGSFEDRLREFKEALAQKPIAMVIRSACKTLSNYRSGILTDDGDCACSDVSCIDHAILMVGYDDTDPIPYFKMKNSWGDGWGEGGYFRVAQTQKGRYGLFGMLAEGVITDAQNVTVQVYDEEQETPFSQWWVILLIVLGGICLICICLGVIQRMRRSKADD